MNTVAGTSPTFTVRVLSYFEQGSGCWLWTGAIDSYGYGVIGRGSRKQGLMRAHRAVYELFVGPVPEGLVLDHLCRNRSCVNPAHLEPVTLAVNIMRGRGLSVIHAQQDVCQFGHPKDGRLGARGGKAKHRYCKTCARAKSRARTRRLAVAS